MLNENKLRRIIANEVKSIVSYKSKARRHLLEAEEAAGGSVALDISAGPSAAVEYLNGPGADKRVRALLSAGKADGDESDEAAQVSESSAKIGELIPTQVEIELTKSIAFPLAKFDSMKSMISGGTQRVGPPGNDMIVKSGNLIVDGHHRWSSLFSVAGPTAVIAAIDISLPEKDAASVLAIVQTAIAATLSGPVPKAKAGGMNILGKSKDEIASMIRKTYESGGGEVGAILTDEYVSKCLADAEVSAHFGLNSTASGGTAKKEIEGGQKVESKNRLGSLLEKSSSLGKNMGGRIVTARNTIINRVAENLSMMNQPAEGAPPRVDMPQLDAAGGGVQGVMAKLQSGDVNYKPPFESANKAGQVVVERWQRLAGLIK